MRANGWFHDEPRSPGPCGTSTGVPRWLGKVGRLLVAEKGADHRPPDLVDLVPVDEAVVPVDLDDYPVEEVQLGYLQHVLDRTEVRAARARHRRAPG
jgi:hypothetical protein